MDDKNSISFWMSNHWSSETMAAHWFARPFDNLDLHGWSTVKSWNVHEDRSRNRRRPRRMRVPAPVGSARLWETAARLHTLIVWETGSGQPLRAACGNERFYKASKLAPSAPYFSSLPLFPAKPVPLQRMCAEFLFFIFFLSVRQYPSLEI